MNPFTLQANQAKYIENLKDAEFCRNTFQNKTDSAARSFTLPNINEAIASLSEKVKMQLRLTSSAPATR